MTKKSRKLGAGERRILSAVAEAMIPAGSVLPSAERDVKVAEPLADFLGGAPGRQLSRVRLALWALELSPLVGGHFRRFSKLGLGARSRHLAGLERSRVPLKRDLLALFKGLTAISYCRSPAVQDAIGYSAGCEGPKSSYSPPKPYLEPDELAPLEADIECDVVVVGSGAGGAVAAYELAKQGHSVVILEEGSYHDRRTFSNDPLQAMSSLYRDNGLTVLEGRPTIPLPLGRCVGGTTLINSGTCFRAQEGTLRQWREESGAKWASLETLGPIFDELESELLIEPVDVETMGRNGQLCMEGAKALGASGGPIMRYADGCRRCGSCPLGCPLDLKQATHVSFVPRAVEAGAKLFVQTRAEKLLIDNGRLRGMRAVNMDGSNGAGRSFDVRAGTVVLATGAVGTPELLMRSGLSGRNGSVGRNLHVHPACWVGAKYGEDVRGWEGVMQSYYVDQWHDQGLLIEATFTPLPFAGPWLPGTGVAYKRELADFGHLASFGVHLSDRSSGSVRVTRRGDTALTYKLVDSDVKRLVSGIARAADLHFAAGALEVYPHTGKIDRLLPGDQLKLEGGRFKASDLTLEAFHPMGTARLGKDSSSSATDPSGMVHGVEGLYVADASLFPTSLGVNPMLTIMAVARHLSRRLGEQIS